MLHSPDPLPAANGATHLRAVEQAIADNALWVPTVRAELARVVVGQRALVDRLLVACSTGGHVLLEGVPGLAKTLVAQDASPALDGRFSRIQFTPDLLPADIIGTLIYNPRESGFSVKQGPVFANFVLADEINRAPAKVQSALLEAMQERQVTIGERDLRAADAVPGARDPEPDRAGGHLSAARGPGRPLHAQGQGRLPDARRGARRSSTAWRARRRASTSSAVVDAPTRSCAAREVVGQVFVDDKIKRYIVDLVVRDPRPEARRPAISPPSSLRRLAAGHASRWRSAARAYALLARAAATSRRRTSRRSACDVLRHRVLSPTRPRPARPRRRGHRPAGPRARAGAVRRRREARSAENAATKRSPECIRRMRDVESGRAAWSTDVLVGRVPIACSRAAAWSSTRSASTCRATTSAPSTGTSPRAPAQPYVKRYVEERELTVMLLVDVSASAAFGIAPSAQARDRGRARRAARASARSATTTRSGWSCSPTGSSATSRREGRRARAPGDPRDAPLRPERRGTDLPAPRLRNRVTRRRAVAFLLSDF